MFNLSLNFSKLLECVYLEYIFEIGFMLITEFRNDIVMLKLIISRRLEVIMI